MDEPEELPVTRLRNNLRCSIRGEGFRSSMLQSPHGLQYRGSVRKTPQKYSVVSRLLPGPGSQLSVASEGVQPTASKVKNPKHRYTTN